jgi:hypothetical protein
MTRTSTLLRLTPVILLTACTVPTNPTQPVITPAPSVTRAETIAIAQRYATLVWQPETHHVFHGLDRNQIRVDTPDIGHQPTDGSIPGWWIPGRPNVGMPYQWGGFDTPDSFLRGLAQGRFAGDLYTSEKRRMLYDAVSDQCVGIDCSGFISRCWRLDRPYSTRDLPAICDPLPDFTHLRQGDIANKSNHHVLLFDHWTNPRKTHFMAYETGSPPTWKVERHIISVAYIKNQGFQPYRYRRIRD